MSRLYRTLTRSSIGQFLVLGGAAFALTSWLSPPTAPELASIAINADDIALLHQRQSERAGHALSDAEFAPVLDQYLDDQRLLQRAFELGLDRGNPAVENRLLRLLEYLGEADRGSVEQQLDHARALGLDRSDPMIQRTLIEAMRYLVSHPTPQDLPSAEEVITYYREHPEEFALPEQFVFEHIYFSRTRHGEPSEQMARAALTALRDPAAASNADAFGDPFLHGRIIGPLSSTGVGKLFGAAFSAAIAEHPIGEWFGPVVSSYGYHVVRLRRRDASSLAELDEVRSRIVHRLAEASGRRRLEDWQVGLRQSIPLSEAGAGS